jgi:hypothetical protein
METLRPAAERTIRQASERPVPPIVHSAPGRKAAPVAKWAEPVKIPAAPTWGEPAETASSRVHLPELATPAVPEFHTRAAEVTAIPFELARSVVGEVYKAPDSAISTELRRMLGNPTALRSAILLREILGPSRSLQSLDDARSLAPL